MEVDTTGTEDLIEASDSDVDVDDSNIPSSAPQLSSAQLLMQATLGQAKLPSAKSKKPTYTPPKRAYAPKQTTITKQNKQAALMSQSVKQAKILAEAVKQASATAQNKANLAAARNIAKQAALLSKASTSQALQAALVKLPQKCAPKTVKLPTQSPKAAQSPKQAPAVKQTPTSPMQPPPSPKHPPSPKQPPSPRPQSPLQLPSPKAIPARQLQSANKPAASAKQPLISGKQLPESTLPSRLPAPKHSVCEKQFPPVYLSQEELSLSSKELPQSNKQLLQMEIKPQTVFLPPQTPMQLPPSPKKAPQSPMTPPQSTMPPPQLQMPTPQSAMLPPPSPMLPPQTIKHLPQTSKQLSQTAKQLSQTPKQISQTGKQLPQTAKQPPFVIKHTESSKPTILTKSVVPTPQIKTITQQISIPMLSQANATLSRSSSLPTIIAPPQKSPLIKQRTSIKEPSVS